MLNLLSRIFCLLGLHKLGANTRTLPPPQKNKADQYAYRRCVRPGCKYLIYLSRAGNNKNWHAVPSVSPLHQATYRDKIVSSIER